MPRVMAADIATPIAKFEEFTALSDSELGKLLNHFDPLIGEDIRRVLNRGVEKYDEGLFLAVLRFVRRATKVFRGCFVTTFFCVNIPPSAHHHLLLDPLILFLNPLPFIPVFASQRREYPKTIALMTEFIKATIATWPWSSQLEQFILEYEAACLPPSLCVDISVWVAIENHTDSSTFVARRLLETVINCTMERVKRGTCYTTSRSLSHFFSARLHA